MLLLSLSFTWKALAPYSGTLAVLGTVLYVLSFSLGAGPVPALLLPEIFASRIRAKAVALSLGMHWVTSFVIGLYFLSMSKRRGGPWRKYNLLLTLQLEFTGTTIEAPKYNDFHFSQSTQSSVSPGVCNRPPKFGDGEYDSYIDSDLWDLPWASLTPLDGEDSQSEIVLEGAESCSDKLNLMKFNVDAALDQLGFRGPTVFIIGKLKFEAENAQELSKWMSVPSCLQFLLEVKPNNDRMGPLVVAGLLSNLARSRMLKVPPALRYQLMEIVTALPRKLVVFVTHHHHDHVDGLSIIQKCNPDATLLAHENTMRRIGKGDWSLGYTSISGGEEICIGGERLKTIFAPGHTDGHMALLHVSSHSLVVGDHCVGQGSAVLDYTSGGNMKVCEFLHFFLFIVKYSMKRQYVLYNISQIYAL
ncbi:hypothetical protein NE237_026726 [Protea cynaroides]|uniref:Metallo-beta-lactamase domain-containing protein n=1 Tax=Protea cynaroides TaxID=273540 RepID=A0A9Q0GNR7_9MAGN|nr:hypothetical protein NE237_026726 [Protea cynaroides]